MKINTTLTCGAAFFTTIPIFSTALSGPTPRTFTRFFTTFPPTILSCIFQWRCLSDACMKINTTLTCGAAFFTTIPIFSTALSGPTPRTFTRFFTTFPPTILSCIFQWRCRRWCGSFSWRWCGSLIRSSTCISDSPRITSIVFPFCPGNPSRLYRAVMPILLSLNKGKSYATI